MGCPFAFDDAVMENDNAENRENSHPNISKVDDTIRKRNRGLRGKAFRSGKHTWPSSLLLLRQSVSEGALANSQGRVPEALGTLHQARPYIYLILYICI